MEPAIPSLSGWTELSEAVEQFVNFLWPAVSALAAVGLVSMSLIEVAKVIFHLRRRYHREQLEHIFSKARADAFPEFVVALRQSSKDWLEFFGVGQEKLEQFCMDSQALCTQPDKLWAAVVGQATSGDENALLDLRPDRLVGQIDAAFQLSLTSPSRQIAVFWFAAGGANREDLKTLVLAALGRGINTPEDLIDEDPRIEGLVMEARNRVAAQAQRQFDAWQLKFEHAWKTRMHVLSVVLSSLFIAGVGTLRQTRFDQQIDPVDWVFWILVAIFGGMFAPVARDFLVGLKNIRERVR